MHQNQLNWVCERYSPVTGRAYVFAKSFSLQLLENKLEIQELS